MTLEHLTGRIKSLIQFDISLQDEGPLVGFNPYDEGSYFDTFNTNKLAVQLELEKLSKDFSDAVSESLLTIITERKNQLLKEQDDVLAYGNASVTKVFNAKLNFCDDLVEFISNIEPDQQVLPKEKRININLPLNEIAILLYAFEKKGIWNLDGGDIKNLLSKYCNFYSEETKQFETIKPGSLGKSISKVRAGFDTGFKTEANSVNSFASKLEDVLYIIKEIHKISDEKLR